MVLIYQAIAQSPGHIREEKHPEYVLLLQMPEKLVEYEHVRKTLYSE